jgi:uncharacterized protein (DUF697 family)
MEQPEQTEQTEQETPLTESEIREARIEQANEIVKSYALGSMAVGIVIPIPLVDMIALAGVQLKLVHSLANHYEVEFSNELGKSVIAGLLGGSFTVEMSASLVKAIPIVGQISGMISTAVIGGGATYAIGKVFIQHFETGGTLLNFDPEAVREYFAEQFEEGKKVAAQKSTEKASA